MRCWGCDAMDIQWMARQLPEKPPEGLKEWAIRTHGESELGGEFCIWSSERMRMQNGRSEWIADCTCTACSEDFITQKEPGEKAIRLVCGEDGSYYPIEPGEPVDPYMGIELQRDGDDFYCPICGSKVELIHRSKLRGGRTKRIMILSIETVQGYAAVVYWMVERHLAEFGNSTYTVAPEEAYVLTEHGGLKRFSHVHRHGSFFGANRYQTARWYPMSSNHDVIDQLYPDWRSVNNTKQGADVWLGIPDLEGTTGEKTALECFLRAGGYRAVEYLKWWRTQRNIENLGRQGQAKLVVDIMRRAYRYSYALSSEAAKVLDLSKNKPHEMLRISKEDFRWLREHRLELTVETMERWKAYKDAGGRLALTDFLELAGRYGSGGANAAIDILRQYGHDMDKVARYLEKRNCRLSEAGILLDTRRALRELTGRELTEEELWPKHLHEMHDRVNEQLRQRRQSAARRKTMEGFRQVLDQYGSLAWTDGELCVVLPRSADDLEHEGAVLRHCVGGYSSQHISGSSVIFFIRHYRRPERPYYTLAINMLDRPKRSQLHGYGNERHGPNKEYTHKIPYKVQAFCDRWEKEVLHPWYVREQKNKKEAKTA